MRVASSPSVEPTQPGSAQSDGYHLTQRRVYIFPTRFGLIFYLVLLVMLAGSVNYNNSLGFALTFLLGSLSLVTIFHTYRNLAGIRLRLRPGRAIFAGQNATFTLHLNNHACPERIGITVTHLRDAQESSPHVDSQHTNIPSDGDNTLDLKIQTKRRGRMKLGRIVVASRYPLGLFRTWSNYEPDVSIIVFPRLDGIRELPHTPSSATSPGGKHLTGTDDFTGLRNYVPGDSSRRIHWKAMARDQEAIVKQFSGSAPTEIKLSWMQTPQSGLEARLSQLALWVVQAHHQGLAFSLDLPSKTFQTAEGMQHRQRCLRALALHGWTKEKTDAP